MIEVIRRKDLVPMFMKEFQYSYKYINNFNFYNYLYTARFRASVKIQRGSDKGK